MNAFPQIPKEYFIVEKTFHPTKGALKINEIPFKKGSVTHDIQLNKNYPQWHELIGTKLRRLSDKEMAQNMPPIITTGIKRELLNILTDENLFQNINKEFDKKIVGEHETRKTIFLVAFGGRITQNAAPTSYNLMVNDDSGAGKDHVCKSVLGILPTKNTLHRTRISPTALTYWHNKKFEPEWTWDGKTLYLEDVSNSVLNCDVFKVFASKKGTTASTITINQRATEIITEGKPSLIVTIACAFPKGETLRRFPITNLNTSQKQTELIIQRQAEMAETGLEPEYDPAIIHALSYLKRVKVKVPFGKRLIGLLSSKNIIVRTHFKRFLDYCKFSAAIHQYNRDVDAQGYIIANGQDYDIARCALLKTTSNVFSIPLTKNQKRILKIMKGLGEICYSVSDLEPKISFLSNKSIYLHLGRLVEYGFLVKDKQDRDNSTKAVMVYSLAEVGVIEIPTWKNLQKITIDKSDTNVTSITSVTIDDENKQKSGTIVTNVSIVMENQVTELKYSDWLVTARANIEAAGGGVDSVLLIDSSPVGFVDRAIKEGDFMEVNGVVRCVQ